MDDDAIKAGLPPSVDGILTRPGLFSIEKTLEVLKREIQRRQLTLFSLIDHNGEAKRVCLRMQQAHVLIFGNPKAGTPVMIASPLPRTGFATRSTRLAEQRWSSMGQLHKHWPT